MRQDKIGQAPEPVGTLAKFVRHAIGTANDHGNITPGLHPVGHLRRELGSRPRLAAFIADDSPGALGYLRLDAGAFFRFRALGCHGLAARHGGDFVQLNRAGGRHPFQVFRRACIGPVGQTCPDTDQMDFQRTASGLDYLGLEEPRILSIAVA